MVIVVIGLKANWDFPNKATTEVVSLAVERHYD